MRGPLLELRCSSCRRLFGYVSAATRAPSNRIFCTPMCAMSRVPDPLERRNDWWRILHAHHVSPVTIGKWWGVHYAQVYRVLGRTS